MFQIDPLSRVPVYEQVIEQLEKFILIGAIPPGEQIPSVRGLALEHSVNPRTILKAYSDLDSKGVIKAVPGKGYFVCENALEILGKDRLAELDALSETVELIAMAGIPKEKVINCIEKAYEKVNKGRKE